MLGIPLEDLVFIVVAVGGGVVLLLTGPVNGMARRRLTEPDGIAPLAPALSAFLAMFGVAGLVASRVLDVHGVQAVLAASGAGVVAMGLVVMLRGTEGRAKD